MRTFVERVGSGGRLGSAFALIAMLGVAGAAVAQPVVGTSFPTVGSSVGVGFDPTTQSVWVYGAFDSTLSRYSASGQSLGTIPRPGGSANDADVEFAPAALTLGTTEVPVGTLLFIDGESGPADIYAVNPATGAVLATLATQFGVSHVVGGGYHPGRGTFFLVQDRVPPAADSNLVAEINPITGVVLSQFYVTDALASFTVNFGDLDVAGNGNLLIASSDETSILELTPEGSFVRLIALPQGVTSLAGIALDNSGCVAWVMSSGGVVSSLIGIDGVCNDSCSYDFNQDENVDLLDAQQMAQVFVGLITPQPNWLDGDLNGDENADLTDAQLLAAYVVTGTCGV